MKRICRKDYEAIVGFFVILTMLLTFISITVSAEGMRLRKENTELKEIKKQRDDMRKALIKGNNDILKARKIIQNKIHISI